MHNKTVQFNYLGLYTDFILSKETFNKLINFLPASLSVNTWFLAFIGLTLVYYVTDLCGTTEFCWYIDKPCKVQTISQVC